MIFLDLVRCLYHKSANTIEASIDFGRLLERSYTGGEIIPEKGVGYTDLVSPTIHTHTHWSRVLKEAVEWKKKLNCHLTQFSMGRVPRLHRMRRYIRVATAKVAMSSLKCKLSHHRQRPMRKMAMELNTGGESMRTIVKRKLGMQKMLRLVGRGHFQKFSSLTDWNIFILESSP